MSTTTFTLPVSGMTCASCAGRVERALRKVPGVTAAAVNLANEQVRIDADGSELTTLIQAVETAGYGVPTQVVELTIEGMTCASCVGRVERALLKVPGVRSAAVNLASERARVELLGTLESNALIQAVEGAGYHAQVIEQAQPRGDRVEADERLHQRSAFLCFLSMSRGFFESSSRCPVTGASSGASTSTKSILACSRFTRTTFTRTRPASW